MKTKIVPSNELNSLRASDYFPKNKTEKKPPERKMLVVLGDEEHYDDVSKCSVRVYTSSQFKQIEAEGLRGSRNGALGPKLTFCLDNPDDLRLLATLLEKKP